MINNSDHLYNSRRFSVLFLWHFQVCIKTMQRRQGISKDIREITVAPHQPWKGYYKAISKQSEVCRFAMRLMCGEHSRYLLDFPEVHVPVNSPQG